MNHAPRPEPADCTVCGQPDAFVFADGALCAGCAHVRGSCCADDGRDCSATEAPATAPENERLRLNPNCCYEACPQCSAVRRLREFQARYPHDWESRLDGSARLLAVARLRN